MAKLIRKKNIAKVVANLKNISFFFNDFVTNFSWLIHKISFCYDFATKVFVAVIK